MAAHFSAWSSWLPRTHIDLPIPHISPPAFPPLQRRYIPNHYLSSPADALLQPLYILAIFEAVLAPVCTVAFAITIFRREITYTKDMLYLVLIAISTVVAAVVLALQTQALSSSLDVQAILRIRPDLSSGDVLSAWTPS